MDRIGSALWARQSSDLLTDFHPYIHDNTSYTRIFLGGGGVDTMDGSDSFLHHKVR
jgi:hypothetical protein